MSMGHGTSIVRNNLLFHYDMANTKKSWKGAPTTNLVNPIWTNWSIDGSGQGALGTRSIISPTECSITDVASNTRQRISISGIAASTTYTFSVQYKREAGTPTLRFQIQAYTGATYLSTISFPTTTQLGIVDAEGWQTAKITITTPVGTDTILWYMQDGDDYTTYTHSFRIANPQCEQLSYATPFVNGSRSSTQAIIDLTGNSTLTPTNLNYTSSDFSFLESSGSTAITGIPITSLPALTGHTYEAWIKCTAFPTVSVPNGNGVTYKAGVLVGATYYSGSAIYWTGNSAGTACAIYGFVRGNDAYRATTSFNLSLNTYYHVVTTHGETPKKLRLYINGALFSEVDGATAEFTATNVVSAGNVGINKTQVDGGGTANYSYFNGYVESVKVYNRGLTASEVLQNFNALRGRYGL